MTVVYLDSFLMTNFCINFLLLLASAKLAGEVLHKWRFALAALLGAAYAALTFFPAFCIFLHPVFKIAAAVLMILISFGGSRRILRLSMIFFALSCALGGCMVAIQFLKGATYPGGTILYAAMGTKEILISAVFCYGVLTLFFRRAALHSSSRQRELSSVELWMGERHLTLTALQDNGNTLQDPVTGQPVLVVEGERLRPLITDAWYLTEEALANPIETFRQISEGSDAVRVRLLPYRAVGVDCGMLLAIRLDRVVVDRQSYANYLVALSPTPVSDGGGYHALMGCLGN